MNMLLFYFTCAVVTFGVSWYYSVNFDEFCEEAFSAFRLHSKEESDEMGTYYENTIKVYQPIARIACIQSAALSGSCFLLVAAGLRNWYFTALMLVGMGLLLYIVGQGWYIWFMVIAKEKFYFETDSLEEAERYFAQMKEKLYERNMKKRVALRKVLYTGIGINGVVLVSVILHFFALS